MKIYIDADYRCHTSKLEENFREFDVPYFDDKCTEFIEGYRYVPLGEKWTREDGEEFDGEMVSPAVEYEPLAVAQLLYEKQDMENALAILLGGAV